MGQATTDTEQQTVQPAPEEPAAPATPESAPEPKAPEAPEPAEDEESDEVLRTEFINLKDALEMGQKQLKSIPHVNPESLRRFLQMDLYPILIELADFANWYVGDLHNRLLSMEQEIEGGGGEGLDPEFAEQLLNFIGMSLQVFGVIIRATNANPELLQTTQILVAQAPGLIARIQEITMVDDDADYDDEDEEDEDEEAEAEEAGEPVEVLEPRKKTEPAAEAAAEPEAQPEPETEPAAEATAAPPEPEPEAQPAEAQAPGPELAEAQPETSPNAEEPSKPADVTGEEPATPTEEPSDG
jgi:hypothetical protein